MQPQLTSSMRGTVVRVMTETSSSWGTAACRTIAKPMLVSKQHGNTLDYLTQGLDMETTSITTTCTELHTKDKNMSDLDQEVNNVFINDAIDSAKSTVHQNQQGGTSETAVFDVQSEPSGLLSFKLTEEMSLSQRVSNMVDKVQLSERSILSSSSDVSSMMDEDLNPERPPLTIPPSVFGMADSILSSERPISPSDFLHKDLEQTSQPQMEDLGIPSDLYSEIDEILKEISEDIPLDYSEQLDLNLFSQLEEPDNDIAAHECGLLDEVKRGNPVHCEGDLHNSIVSTTTTPASKIPTNCMEIVQTLETSQSVSQFEEPDNNTAVHECGLLDKVKRGNPVHCEEDLHNSIVSITTTPASKILTNCMEVVQTREPRRNHRKPTRYRSITLLEDSAASSSGTTLTRGARSNCNELSNEEKYIRSRIQNNLASKRCREKRKEKFAKMAIALDELEKKNKDLQDQKAHLTQLRDDFKEFVNKYLFQRITKK